MTNEKLKVFLTLDDIYEFMKFHKISKIHYLNGSFIVFYKKDEE